MDQTFKISKSYPWYRVAAITILWTILFSMISRNASATHAAGADLTYQCLGGLVYQVECTFYRDCDGSAEPNTVTITYKSASLGYSRTAIAQKVLVNNGVEITAPCMASLSSCNGGMSAGIRKWVYRAVITLPSANPDWVFSYKVCCRNCTITTIQSPCATSSELYIEATLNNLVAPCNNSPVFNNVPVAFVCLGQNFNYNQGVYDADGDSLVYELITPKTSATTGVVWLPPASVSAPMASSTPFTLNSVTGDINFTPASIQIGILAIRVNEYRNGQLIGTTIRDMQMYSKICNNSLPIASGINGTANYITSACIGDSLCFQINFQDSDTGQLLSYSVFNPIVGSTITQVASTPNTVLEFCWVPTAADANNLNKTFTITIKDNACPANGIQTYSYSIFVGGFQSSTTVVQPTCNNLSNGSVSVLSDATTPLTYLWNTTPAQHTAIAAGLVAGNYSVRITDQNGCSNTQFVTLTALHTTPAIIATSNGSAPCQGSSNATIQTQVSGGTSPFTYLWSNGASNNSVSGLSPGTYSVTVTDANGCSGSASAIIQPTAAFPVSNLEVTSPIKCLDGSDGSIKTNVSGGTPPYNFVWNNGATTANINNVSAGNYSVTITDALGCATQSSILLTQPEPIAVSVIQSAVTCFNGSNGSAQLSIIGGIQPYSCLWNTGANTLSVTGLQAGNYSVTITDANGCTTQSALMLTQPDPISVSGIEQDVTCFNGSNGSVQLSTAGGIQPYSYTWNTGANTPSLTGLQAGNYSVDVTDGNGCSKSQTFTIIQPQSPLLLLPSVVSNVKCFGGNEGQLDLVVNGGTAPYQYMWNSGSTNLHPGNLQAGSYSVTVTDSHGCSANASVSISEPSPLEVTGNAQVVSCHNGSDGVINLTIVGGEAPYSYLWNTGAANSNLSGLNAGIYSVTVTDVNGCSSSSATTVTQPNQLEITGITQLVSCHNGSNGAININIIGGSAPYSYLWNTGSTISNLTGLNAGTYSVTVTDGKGCKGTKSIQVSEPAISLIINPTIHHAACLNGNNGSINTNIEGGTAPYTYQWSNGATTAQVTGLVSGNYSITVTDSKGCIASRQMQIDDSTTFNMHSLEHDTICVGETVTLVADSVSNGNYQWYYDGNILNGATGMTFITPAAGNYYVTMNHTCGEFTSEPVEVVVKAVENVSVTNSQIVCPPETAQLIAFGGSRYKWTPETFMTFDNVPDPIVNPITSTTYSVEIINDFGCKAFLSTTVSVVCDSLLVPTGFSPNNDGTNDGYVIDGIENYPDNKLWVYNRWGKLVFKARDYANNWDGTGNIVGISSGIKVPPGTYYYILDLNDNQKPRGGYLIIKH